jgi:hypothetical protein
MESGPPIPIYGRGIFTTDIRCKRRDLNAGQQFFQYPGFDPQPLAIAASSAMIAAPRRDRQAKKMRELYSNLAKARSSPQCDGLPCGFAAFCEARTAASFPFG